MIFIGGLIVELVIGFVLGHDSHRESVRRAADKVSGKK